jgi:hypothetical protein
MENPRLAKGVRLLVAFERILSDEDRAILVAYAEQLAEKSRFSVRNWVSKSPEVDALRVGRSIGLGSDICVRGAYPDAVVV